MINALLFVAAIAFVLLVLGVREIARSFSRLINRRDR